MWYFSWPEDREETKYFKNQFSFTPNRQPAKELIKTHNSDDPNIVVFRPDSLAIIVTHWW